MQHTRTAVKAYRRYAMSSGAVPALDEYINMARQDDPSADNLENSIATDTLGEPQPHTLHPQSPAEPNANGWDSWWETGVANGTGLFGCDRAKAYPITVQGCSMPTTARRDSEGSSVSSATSSSTPPADRVYSWSSSTTPESVSPASPPRNEQLARLQPPQRTSSRVAFGPSAIKSPTRTSQGQVSCRAPRSTQTMSRSISTRFHNTPIKSPVPEEEEHPGRHYVHPNREMESDTGCSPFLTCPAFQDGAVESPLHQRRQQRQQRLATYSPFPQPQKTKLSPLPPLPIRQSLNRQLPTTAATSPSSTTSCRPLNKEATRSLPQLRDLAAPLPESLPPLPLVPQFSPLFPASPAGMVSQSPTILAGSSAGAINAPPPHPTMPPPPPPMWAATVSAKSVDKETIPPATAMSRNSKHTSQQQQQHQHTPPDRWEDELRRHKQLLRHFPQQPDMQGERLKIPRMHKSLGNLRARSRAHSTPSASDTIVTTSSGIVYTSSAARSGSRASKHSKSKSLWENTGRLDEPLPPTPQPDAPRVSIFEDDSDDEGDTVRQFVRNLFTRRTRCSEMSPLGFGTHDSVAAPHASKESTATSSVDGSSHNNRKKSYSTSSNFPVGATVGENTIGSSATPITSSGGDMYGCINVEGQAADSPRTSSDNTRQRGPLLTRMFVRRSH